MNEWVAAAGAIGALLTALGGGAGLRVLFRRRPKLGRADAAVALSEGTLRWAERLEASSERALERAETAEQKADAADARADAAERRAGEAERRAALIDAQLGQIVAYVDLLVRAINDPGMDMVRLRQIAAEGPPRLARSSG